MMLDCHASLWNKKVKQQEARIHLQSTDEKELLASVCWRSKPHSIQSMDAAQDLVVLNPYPVVAMFGAADGPIAVLSIFRASICALLQSLLFY